MLELLETDERAAYIAAVKTSIVKSAVPDWNTNDFNKATARLSVDLRQSLFPAMSFSTEELSTGDFYALWTGLAEHQLLTID